MNHTNLVKKYALSIAIAASFFISVAAHAKIYKWTDAQGKVHFSDKKVQLIPRFTMGSSLAWDCRTNLEKSLWVDECRGLD